MLTTLKTVATSCYSALFLILLVGLSACTPKGPKALLEGEKLLAAGQPAEALTQLKLATELLPQNAQAWNHLGLAYHQTGKPEEAARAYNTALKLDRDLVAVRYNLGTLMLDHGDPARALNEFKTFTLLKPESVEGHIQQGTAHLRLRQWNEAEAAFATAQKISRSHPEVLNGLGLVLLQRQRARDAVTYFNAALQQDPKFAAARLNLAVTYHQHLTNYPLALSQYRAYLASQPAPADAEAVTAVVRQLEPLVPGAQAPAAATVSSTGPVSIAALAAAARSNAQATNIRPEPVKPAETVPPAPEVALASPPRPGTERPSVEPPPFVRMELPPRTQAKAEPIRPEPKSTVPVIAPAPVAPPPAVRPPTNTAVARSTPPPAAVSIPVTPAERMTVAAASPPAGAVTEEPEEKPGFFQRINPMNLFRSKPKPPTPLSGLPASTSTPSNNASRPREMARATPPPQTGPVVEVPAPAPPPVVVPPPVIKAPPIPRYPYLNPGPFAAGDKKTAQTAFDQALAAQKVRNWPEAIAGYRKAATADPAYFEAYYNLGWTAYEAKDLRQALVAYEHALAVTPESFDARYNLALALQQAGYPRDAAEEFERLTVLHPTRAQPHLMLASLLSGRLQDKAAARTHYQKVLELEPNHPKATEIRYWLRANQ